MVEPCEVATIKTAETRVPVRSNSGGRERNESPCTTMVVVETRTSLCSFEVKGNYAQLLMLFIIHVESLTTTPTFANHREQRKTELDQKDRSSNVDNSVNYEKRTKKTNQDATVTCKINGKCLRALTDSRTSHGYVNEQIVQDLYVRILPARGSVGITSLNFQLHNQWEIREWAVVSTV